MNYSWNCNAVCLVSETLLILWRNQYDGIEQMLSSLIVYIAVPDDTNQAWRKAKSHLWNYIWRCFYKLLENIPRLLNIFVSHRFAYPYISEKKWMQKSNMSQLTCLYFYIYIYQLHIPDKVFLDKFTYGFVKLHTKSLILRRNTFLECGYSCSTLCLKYYLKLSCPFIFILHVKCSICLSVVESVWSRCLAAVATTSFHLHPSSFLLPFLSPLAHPIPIHFLP